jgi:hypothetical protein
MMVLTCAVVAGGERLLSVALEVDFDFGLRSVGTGSEAPSLHCILRRGAEERMAGFDLGLGDSAVWLNGDEENDGSTDVHATRKFGIIGRDAADHLPVNAAGKGYSGAEEKASYEEKRT